MALSRRTGARFQASIWPGFVDAMTGLLLVLMFVLTIFMVMQFTLRETISGQESELDALSGEVAALAQALGLERERSAGLEADVGALRSTLSRAADEAAAQSEQIAALQRAFSLQTEALNAARDDITGFEAQVAQLLSERDARLADIANLEAQQDTLLSEQEALSLALAQARDEVDAGVEAARLAAAQREALEALVADLRAQSADDRAIQADLQAALDGAQQALTEEEAARLAEAAAAEALRARLQTADAELTAMSLALERQRKEAEETLSQLAAVQAAEDDLTARLADAVLAQNAAREAEESRLAEIDGLQQRLTAALLRSEEAQQQLTALAGSEEELQARLAAALEAGGAAEAAAEDLTAQLSAALAARDLAKQNLAAATEDAAALRADLAAALLAREEAEDAQTDLAAQLAASDAARAALEAQFDDAGRNEAEIRAALAQALAAAQSAQTQAGEAETAAERRAALLATAERALSEQEAQTLEAQRQTALLNTQVAALRDQLGALQALLDDAQERDATARVQLETLGADLNAALARAAAEERQRRLAETARAEEERQRRILEAEKAARLAEQARDLERFRSEFFGRMRDVLGDQAGVRIEGDRFVFQSEVLFPPASAQLSIQGQADIAAVAQILRAVGNDIPPEIDWIIRVDGHTDNLPLSGFGQFGDNWELSQGRALSVVRYMIDVEGIPPERLAANGFGEYQPIDTADTPEARAQNRRIELKLTER